jgi:hypothetical protein
MGAGVELEVGSRFNLIKKKIAADIEVYNALVLFPCPYGFFFTYMSNINVVGLWSTIPL